MLLALYIAVLSLAVVTLLVMPVPFWLWVLGLLLCLLHAAWIVPSHILLTRDSSWLGLRHDRAEAPCARSRCSLSRSSSSVAS